MSKKNDAQQLAAIFFIFLGAVIALLGFMDFRGPEPVIDVNEPVFILGMVLATGGAFRMIWLT